MSKELTPQEQTQELNEAVKFCLERGLIKTDEVRQAQSRQEKLELGCEAMLKKQLYLKAHPSEEKKTEK